MLTAPIIQGTLPAFSGDTITIPFTMSRAVSVDSVSGFSLKIKSLHGSSYLLSLITTDYSCKEGWARFNITSNLEKLSIGSFYKVQLAYQDKKEQVGYYSTVGIIKYTINPTLSIKRNEDDKVFIGTYSQTDGDTTEREYAYRFILKNSSGNILDDTGEQLHLDSGNDDEITSYDSYTYKQDYKSESEHTLMYWVQTNNGLEIEKELEFTPKVIGSVSAAAGIVVTNDFENGYIAVSADLDKALEENSKTLSEALEGINENFFTTVEEYEAELNRVKEYYLEKDKALNSLKHSKEIYLCRSEDGGETWIDLKLFDNGIISWQDKTTEQGKSYLYGYRNDNVRVTAATEAYSDFEYAFLSDGKRQLKIKFNPKMSTFKSTVFESKVDTLGGKYPFFFRNGDVEYKEIALQGLLSYQSDEEGLFMGGLESLFAPLVRRIVPKYVKVRDYIRSRYGDFLGTSQVRALVSDVFINKDNAIFYSEDGVKYAEVTDRKVPDNFDNYYLRFWNEDPVRVEETERFMDETQTSAKIAARERDFKIAALKWLNNGEPKLLRTAPEGNYLVRLMNVSLSPEESLGRMLHSFSATGYEIAECTIDNLIKYGILEEV